MFQALPIQGCRMPQGCRWLRTAGARTETSTCPTSAASTPCAQPCTSPPSSPPSRRGTPCTYGHRVHQNHVKVGRIEGRQRKDRGPEATWTYDRLRLTTSMRGVADLVAMLAVTSTRMSEGSPAMSMSKSAEPRSPLSSLAFLRPLLRPNKHV